jgi:Ca-activated chloride channel family protein
MRFVAPRRNWIGAWLIAVALAGSMVAQQPASQGEPKAQPERTRKQDQKQDQPGQAESERAVREKTASLMERVKTLAPVYQEWVQSVAGLISIGELEYFLDLEQDYRRDAFMEAFWEPRDPDPTTPGNELRQRWEEYKRDSGELPFGDPRFVVYLLNGPPGRYTMPDGRPVSVCYARTDELEIWFYGGSETTSKHFVVIFQKRGADVPYEIYRPGGILRATQRSGGLPTTDVRLLCAEEYLSYALYEIQSETDYEDLLDHALSAPIPSPEWLATFRGSGTDLPEGAKTFEAREEIRFPERNQSRTAMQVLLAVPTAAAPGRRFDSELHHNFVVIGEVIRDGRLFESFNYVFKGPTPEGSDVIPMGFSRYLRPGPVTLRILVEDVFGEQYAQIVRDLDIPSPEGLPQASMPSVKDAAGGAAAGSGPSLQLLAPAGAVQTGVVRFSARSTGAPVDKVTFFLDDKPVLTKRTPPYSVELNLGTTPSPHRVRVVGYSGSNEVATDQLWLNQGAQRFRVRMIEPRPGGIYPGSLTTRVEVDTPDGKPPQRLEIFVNEAAIASLDAPPYEQTIRLPGADTTVIRAVATLADGSTAEDAVLVNTASGLAARVEVQLVEVYALALDRQGRPVRGLEQSAFRVLEQGQPQAIVRFEEAASAPLRAALLVDRSSSMEPNMAKVAAAAQTFATAALRSKEDRVAVLSFADQTTVDQPFTANAAEVERALAGLRPLGRTALNDALIEGLNYCGELEGLTALVLFTDGQDETSRFTMDQVLESARQSGVMVYVVGLEDAFPDRATRRRMEELARETGGDALFLTDLESLPQIYAGILDQLRSRYLLAYQPATETTPGRGAFREITVEVEGQGLEVRARKGYYP